MQKGGFVIGMRRYRRHDGEQGEGEEGRINVGGVEIKNGSLAAECLG